MAKRGVSFNDVLLFLVFFSWVFALSLAGLNVVGAVPYYVDGTPPTVSDVYIPGEEKVDSPNDTGGGKTPVDQPTTPTPKDNPKVTEDPLQKLHEKKPEVVGYLPEKIVIPNLKKELKVANPQSRDVAVLDKDLLTSVVRYPGSGVLGKEGNIFIFGHSTGYRTVHNQLFKAFNGIQTLDKGSVIELHGDGKVNVYQVVRVDHVDADEALVDLRVQPGERKLTLSTCDSFGSKSSRFVVTSEFLSEYPEDQPPAAVLTN
jgi:LPXTG-site transpeptidase (sortase) family protein